MRLNSVFVPHLADRYPPFGKLATGEQTLERYIAEYGVPLYPGGELARMNIAPRTDDQPFFLDLSRTLPPALGRLLRGVGALVVLAGLWLGWRRRRAGARAAARGVGAALYFALLGAGFMLLEVPLIQQFVLFLEHPVRSMTLVLFALLLGTAAGSRLSQRWPVLSLPGW